MNRLDYKPIGPKPLPFRAIVAAGCLAVAIAVWMASALVLATPGDVWPLYVIGGVLAAASVLTGETKSIRIPAMLLLGLLVMLMVLDIKRGADRDVMIRRAGESLNARESAP